GEAASADQWCEAVAQGHARAIAFALGALVSAGHYDRAAKLFDQVREASYVSAACAWNVGCAYVALGYLDAAAAMFEYHSRVTTRSYQPDQQRPIAQLFETVERPMPHPNVTATIGQRGSAAKAAAKRDPAAVAVTEFHRRHTSVAFIAASKAVRAGTA